MPTSTHPLKQASAGYASPDQARPLKAYAGLAATYAVALGGALVALHRSGRELPERFSAADLMLTGVATHKVTRLIAKDKVTSFIRSPFTCYQEHAGHGELDEEPRGSGLRYAIGELLVCPYCLGQWVGSSFAIGLVAAPRHTRFLATIFVADTISDVLQIAYKAAGEQV